MGTEPVAETSGLFTNYFS